VKVFNWKEVLKNKLITTPITDINIKKIPKGKDRDCCEETRIFYMIETGKYVIRALEEKAAQVDKLDFSENWYKYLVARHGENWKTKFDENNDKDCIQAYKEEHKGIGGGVANIEDCDLFRKELIELGIKSSDAALEFWRECEK
jgi:hypothetical protein